MGEDGKPTTGSATHHERQVRSNGLCTWWEQLPPTIVPPSYTFKFYDHAVISHVASQLQQYGGLQRFATQHVEHSNAWWKQFLNSHTSCGGGWPGLASSCRLFQAMRRFLMMGDPKVRAQMMGDVRQRAPRTCRRCGDVELEGHSRRCPERLKLKQHQQEAADAAAASAAFVAAAAHMPQPILLSAPEMLSLMTTQQLGMPSLSSFATGSSQAAWSQAAVPLPLPPAAFRSPLLPLPPCQTPCGP